MRIVLLLIFISLSSCQSYLSAEQEKEYEKRNVAAQKAVTDWIKKYAKYPDSYEAVSFSDYSESFTSVNEKRIPESDSYVIKHSHKMLNKDSVLSTFSGYFIMEYDYFVSIIEKERSSATGKVFPPKTQVWMDVFGREANKQDSLEYKERYAKVTGKLVNELTKGLESGRLKTESPQDAYKLKELLDTLNQE